MASGPSGNLDVWRALPGDDAPTAEETSDYINVVAGLGGERGLVNSAENVGVHLVHNGLRLIANYATKTAGIGQLQWQEGVTANASPQW
eukprot:5192507-Amphidinium_carterae.1